MFNKLKKKAQQAADKAKSGVQGGPRAATDSSEPAPAEPTAAPAEATPASSDPPPPAYVEPAPAGGPPPSTSGPVPSGVTPGGPGGVVPVATGATAAPVQAAAYPGGPPSEPNKKTVGVNSAKNWFGLRSAVNGGPPSASASDDRANRNLVSGIKTARRKLVIRGWEGTVKVAASVLGVELMMGVIVSGHEGEETVTTAEVEAEVEAEAAAENIDPDELLEDNSGKSFADVEPEVYESGFSRRLNTALEFLLSKLEKTARYMHLNGLRGIVGASIEFKLFGTGMKIELELELGSIAIDFVESTS